jgi:hypothetical protein
MSAEIAESKFNWFAHDYFVFLALRYGLSHNRRIRVVLLNNQNWRTTMPAKLREATENSTHTQPQHITLTLQSETPGKPTEEEKRPGLRVAGFTEKQAEDLKKCDAALFVNLDQPAMTKDGKPYIWNVMISHHVLHMIELFTDQRLITEKPNEHDYDALEAIEHLNRFVGWVTIPTFIDRYVPTRD